MTECLTNFIFQTFPLIGIVFLANLLSCSDITSLAYPQYGPWVEMFPLAALEN